MNFQQVLGIFKKKPLAPAVDATGRPLLQKNPGRAYVSGGSLPPKRPINTSATVPLTQQGVGQLPMSGSQQQVMQVISTDPADVAFIIFFCCPTVLNRLSISIAIG